MKYYGYCADGHLHQIRPEYVKNAKEDGENFDSAMFHPADARELVIDDEESFVPLAPTNCPHLERMLEFDRPWRTLKLPERPMAPYLSDMDIDRTVVLYLTRFEKHGDRCSQSKEQGAVFLFQLIEKAMRPELTRNQAQGMTYEALRQALLRKFWSIEEQQKTFSDLRQSFYPMYKEQHVRDYVFYWLELFTCQTYYLTRTIYEELMKKIPEMYRSPMEQFKKGGSFYDFYGALIEFENTKWPGKYVDYPAQVQRLREKEFQRSMITYDKVLAVLVALFGIGLGCAIYFDDIIRGR